MFKESLRGAIHDAAQVIFDKQGFNILALDIHGVSSLTGDILIAEGNVDRHVIALAQGGHGCPQERGALSDACRRA